MYKKEFDQHISNDTLSNAIILFGESHFFIDRYAKALSDIEDASKLAMYHDEYNFSTAFAHLSQGSLFGDANLLLIKTEKKVPKADLDKLVEACRKNPTNRFIYAYYGSDHKTCDKSFTSKTGGMGVRFFDPTHGESIAFISQEAQKAGIKMDKYTINHLLQAQNSDLFLAASELEKLKLFDKEITTKDIDEFVYGLAHITVEQLINKVLMKQDFKENLQRILEAGEDEIRIITAFTAFITQLYLFNIYIRVNGAPNSLEILGYNLPQFILNEKATFSLKFKPSAYKNMLDILLSSELKIKSSGVDKEAILFSALIKLQKAL
ncbi:DNA polymerase III subunit delta [Sulfurimonas sp. HSL-1716]|uniref:DNA polymerase III subunit delta n=1 Tax=Hydrocurvibacter sulfurireducens TaxID=3131937 RepID=UPI0031F869A1